MGWDALQELVDPLDHDVVVDGVQSCTLSDGIGHLNAFEVRFAIDVSSFELDGTTFEAEWERALEERLRDDVDIEVDSSLKRGPVYIASSSDFGFVVQPGIRPADGRNYIFHAGTECIR